MRSRLADLVGRWCRAVKVPSGQAPASGMLKRMFEQGAQPYRPGADPRQVDAWERRHGFRLPRGLRAWLLLSDGLYRNGAPLIHPLTAIGPMIPFAQVPELMIQPESWFELGNPNVETVCIDLAYRWPGGCCPIFTSGDDARQSPPRVISPGFDAWFLRLLREGGREYWFDPGYRFLGDPWSEHRQNTPVPELPPRLLSLATKVRPLMQTGVDDRWIATKLGISRCDVEIIFRHLQHEHRPVGNP